MPAGSSVLLRVWSAWANGAQKGIDISLKAK
jgi:hypothetical protein